MKDDFIKIRISSDDKLRCKEESERYGYKSMSKYVIECIHIGRRYHASQKMIEESNPLDQICGRTL